MRSRTDSVPATIVRVHLPDATLAVAHAAVERTAARWNRAGAAGAFPPGTGRATGGDTLAHRGGDARGRAAGRRRGNPVLAPARAAHRAAEGFRGRHGQRP